MAVSVAGGVAYGGGVVPRIYGGVGLFSTSLLPASLPSVTAVISRQNFLPAAPPSGAVGLRFLYIVFVEYLRLPAVFSACGIP